MDKARPYAIGSRKEERPPGDYVTGTPKKLQGVSKSQDRNKKVVMVPLHITNNFYSNVKNQDGTASNIHIDQTTPLIFHNHIVNNNIKYIIPP